MNIRAMFRPRMNWERSFSAAHPAESQPRRAVKARFDAAQTTDENAEHWKLTDGLDAASANSLAVRKVIRERARYESDNNTYLGGAVDSMARDIVGRGPRVLFDGDIMRRKMPDGKTLAEHAERDWENWCAEVCYGEKLETAVRAWTVDGETYVYPFARKKHRGRIALDVRLYETDQVSTPYGKPSDVDGIILDADSGEVKSFWLLKTHPGNTPEGGFLNRVTSFIGKYQGEEVPAERLWQLYTPKRAGQLRGIPEIHAALSLGPLHRRYTLATVKAAESAASMAGVLQTDTPDEGAAEIPPAMKMSVAHNTMVSTPEGWKLSQLKPEQPTSTFKEFSRELVQGEVRCIGVPLSVALGNSSGYNYASGRLDHQGYYRMIDVKRDRLENRIIDPTVELWLTEFLLIFGIPSQAVSEITWEYTWDGMMHVDPVKDANADDINLSNNSETLSDVCARRGKNWRRVIRQRGEEKRELEKEGLTMKDVAPADKTDKTTPDNDGSEPENETK